MYLCGENKGADKLRGYSFAQLICGIVFTGNRAADLRLCFRICKNRVSYDATHFVITHRIEKQSELGRNN